LLAVRRAHRSELTYKSIKSTLRGTARRLRGHTADLAQQETGADLGDFLVREAQSPAS
jgi:hypothetical protein